MNITVRPLQGDEMLDALYALSQYAFHPSPPFTDKEEWLGRVRGRKGYTCHAALEDERPVAVACSTSMTQNVRGALYPSAAVWGVATHPSARRKGYCRQAIASLLAAERQSGKVVSALYPFRESFYQRLGYVTYPQTKIARFAPPALAPLLKLELGGEIELKLIGEAYETYRAYLAELQPRRHGLGLFDFGDQAAAARNHLWVALARFDGAIEGLMLYSLKGEEITHFNFSALRFYYQTSRARALLLGWIARHIDQADRAELHLAPDETPETWLADLQVKVESAFPTPMGRVLDVAAAGGMSAGPGSFTAQVSDPLCPWNSGAWRFESVEGRLAVSPAAQAECALSIQGLGALMAGTHDPQDFSLRGWGDPSPALQETLREMFPRRLPHIHEMF